MEPIIEVENLSKKFTIGSWGGSDTLRETLAGLFKKKEDNRKDFWALRDVNFTVNPGEVTGIIGRNGAGKSTLLKILSQISPPTHGTIKLRGRVASLLEVGTGFNPELTGRENIFLNGAILGMSRHEISRKFDEIIAFSEVEKFLDTPVKRYSSGMYVRLAFAVAAHLEPEILIVDEVLAVGDIQFQKKCLGKMEDVSTKQGRTVLFVSHNLSAVSMLCKNVILLENGSIRKIGKTESVIKTYLRLTKKVEDISKRVDRSGDSKAIVADLFLQNQSHKRTNHVRTDEPFEFVIKVISQPESIGKNIAINLVVTDQKENRVFALQSEITGNNFRIKGQEEYFVCEVPNGLPLLPGSYSVTFSLVVSGLTADKMTLASDFEITPTNFYGTNLLPEAEMGSILVKNKWSELEI